MDHSQVPLQDSAKQSSEPLDSDSLGTVKWEAAPTSPEFSADFDHADDQPPLPPPLPPSDASPPLPQEDPVNGNAALAGIPPQPDASSQQWQSGQGNDTWHMHIKEPKERAGAFINDRWSLGAQSREAHHQGNKNMAVRSMNSSPDIASHTRHGQIQMLHDSNYSHSRAEEGLQKHPQSQPFNSQAHTHDIQHRQPRDQLHADYSEPRLSNAKPRQDSQYHSSPSSWARSFEDSTRERIERTAASMQANLRHRTSPPFGEMPNAAPSRADWGRMTSEVISPHIWKI